MKNPRDFQCARGREVVGVDLNEAGIIRLVDIPDVTEDDWDAIFARVASYVGPSGVRVNAVLPGIIDTPMQDEVVEVVASIRGLAPEELHRQRLQKIPLQNRAGQPQAVAQGIAFLLSSAAGHITGQGLGIDGGLVMS